MWNLRLTARLFRGSFFKIFDEQQLEYVLLAGGENEEVYMVGKIAAFQVQSLLVAYKERFDKDKFYQKSFAG